MKKSQLILGILLRRFRTPISSVKSKKKFVKGKSFNTETFLSSNNFIKLFDFLSLPPAPAISVFFSKYFAPFLMKAFITFFSKEKHHLNTFSTHCFSVFTFDETHPINILLSVTAFVIPNSPPTPKGKTFNIEKSWNLSSKHC